MKWCGVLLCWGLTLSANGAEQHACAGKTSHRSVVKDSATLAVVPFAVPIAVPVAVVSQPAVFYARRVELVSDRFGSAAGISQDATASLRTAEEVLRTRCASCHTGESAKGELQLFEQEGKLAERLPRRAILEAVVEGRMPKGAATLTEEEIELLSEWSKPPRELVY